MGEMGRLTRLLGVVLLLCCGPGPFSLWSWTAFGQAPNASFLEAHCYDCHDDEVSKGGLNLLDLPFKPEDDANRAVWETVFDRAKHHEMPPKKRPRPDRTQLKNFLRGIAGPIVIADKKAKSAEGRVNARRLTRREYEYTLHDLLGIDIPFDQVLPEDTAVHGFETVASGQQLSHYHLARYLEAADLALAEAFKRLTEDEQTFHKKLDAEAIVQNGMGNYRGLDQRGKLAISWVHGLQFHGRIPETRVPRSGWYRVTLHDLQAINPKTPSLWGTLKSGACLSNEPLLFPIGLLECTKTPRDVSFEAWIRKDHLLELRPRDIGLRYAPPGDTGGNVSYKGRDLRKQGYPGIALSGVSLERIYPNATAKQLAFMLVGDMNTQRFYAEKDSAKRRANLDRSIRRFAQRAFRRSLSAAQLKPYLELGRSVYAEKDSSYYEALRAAYRAILCSPRFLVLTEEPGQLDQHALATRLSYMLWNSQPDAELRKAADAGKLSEKKELHRHAYRMVDHPRFDRFIESFCDQWLNLRDINETSPDKRKFSMWNEPLQESVLAETRGFVKELFVENLSVTHFIESDFAMLNERLVRHYGFEELKLKAGGGLQRVSVKGNKRDGGLVTQAAILKITANGTTTSPVVRGVWVGERLLGLHIPPPPPDVPAVEPDIRGAVSIRDQLAKHKSNDSCAACHEKIDPAGFALENFDPVGHWRTWYGETNKSAKIDASGVTHDGKKFSGIASWKNLQLEDREQLARGFAGQLITYATGAPPRFSDRIAIEKAIKQSANKDYGLRSILHAVIDSEVFRSK